jgi:hypothetical protein
MTDSALQSIGTPDTTNHRKDIYRQSSLWVLMQVKVVGTISLPGLFGSECRADRTDEDLVILSRVEPEPAQCDAAPDNAPSNVGDVQRVWRSG